MDNLAAVDTFFVSTLKGMGYLQSVTGSCWRIFWDRSHTFKLSVTAVHISNEDVSPFSESHEVQVLLTESDNAREFFCRSARNSYEIFFQLEGMEQRTTKVRAGLKATSLSNNSTACCSIIIPWLKTAPGAMTALIRKKLDIFFKFYNN